MVALVDEQAIVGPGRLIVGHLDAEDRGLFPCTLLTHRPGAYVVERPEAAGSMR